MLGTYRMRAHHVGFETVTLRVTLNTRTYTDVTLLACRLQALHRYRICLSTFS